MKNKKNNKAKSATKTLKFLKMMVKQGYGLFLKECTGDSGFVSEPAASIKILLSHDDLPDIDMFAKVCTHEVKKTINFCKKHHRTCIDSENGCTFKSIA